MSFGSGFGGGFGQNKPSTGFGFGQTNNQNQSTGGTTQPPQTRGVAGTAAAALGDDQGTKTNSAVATGFGSSTNTGFGASNTNAGGSLFGGGNTNTGGFGSTGESGQIVHLSLHLSRWSSSS